MIRILFLLILFTAAGCSTREVHSADAAGEDLYKNKCGGCHRVYKKTEYKPAEWEKIVKAMSTKSRLTEAEERQIIKYLSY